MIDSEQFTSQSLRGDAYVREWHIGPWRYSDSQIRFEVGETTWVFDVIGSKERRVCTFSHRETRTASTDNPLPGEGTTTTESGPEARSERVEKRLRADGWTIV